MEYPIIELCIHVAMMFAAFTQQVFNAVCGCELQNAIVTHSSAYPLMSGYFTVWDVGLGCIGVVYDTFNISTNVCALFGLVIYISFSICSNKLIF